MKVCVECHQHKNLDEYYDNQSYPDGKHNKCRDCVRKLARNRYLRKAQEIKAYQKEYRKNNKTKIRTYHKHYREKNAATIKAIKAAYAKTPTCKQQQRRYYLSSKSIRNQRASARKKNDPAFKLRCNVSCAIASALKAKNTSKGGRSWQLLVGYSTDQLREHLQRLWLPGMNWSNYGWSSRAEKWWTIDHKIAQAHFHYSSPNDPQFKQCWALNNLQPMWSSDNFRKGKGHVLASGAVDV